MPGTHVTEITLNHEFLMSSFNTTSEKALSRVALEHHKGENLRVLVGGLGLGYTCFEALQSTRVATVDVVEFLPEVISWMAQGLIPLSESLNGDRRLTQIHGDVYQRLLDKPTHRYDLILVDVDHSPDDRLAGGDWEPNKAFYTESGLNLAKQHLSPRGILGIWSYAESSSFADALRKSFDEVWLEPVTFDNLLVDEETTDWLFFARDREQGPHSASGRMDC